MTRERELSVDVVRSIDEFSRLEREWRALEAEAHLTLPFQTFEWNLAWWSSLADSGPGGSDELVARVFHDSHTGRLVGAAPLMVSRRPARGPLRARIIQPFGGDPNITELRGLVCAIADEAAVADALWNDLLKRDDQWDWILWCGVRADSEASRRIERHRTVRWLRERQGYELPLLRSFEQLRSSLPRNLKESLRKCYNSLKRDGHVFEFQAVRSWAEAGPALATLVKLHAKRSEQTGTVTHADVFASTSSRRFLSDVCARFAARDGLCVFALRIGNQTVATRIGFIVGDSLYLYYSGYEPKWSGYSVMTTCVAEAIRWAIDAGLRSVNLSTGADPSKTRWRPIETLYRDGIQMYPRRGAELNASLIALGERIRAVGPIGRLAGHLIGRRG